MKRLIALVLILMALLGAYVWYQSQNINPNEVLQVNIYKEDTNTPEHSYYKEDIESISVIVDIFNNLDGNSASSTDVNVSSDKYVLDIITDNGKVYNFDLTIDLDDVKLDIYDNVNEQYLYPSNEQIERLLSMEGFYSLYETSSPTIQLTYSTITIPAQVSSSQWKYVLANGDDMDKKSQHVVTPEDSSIPLHPDHSVSVFSEKSPALMTLKVFANDTLIREEEIKNNTFLPSKYDGQLRYEVTSSWSKTNELEPFGTSTMTFYGNMDIEPELTMDKTSATAGDVIVLEIFNVNEGQTPKIEQTLSKDLKIWKSEDRYFAFLSMNYWVKPGDYTIKLVVEDSENTFSKTYPIRIDSKEFNKQYLTIDKKVEASTRNDEAYAEYAKYFTPTRDESISEKLWDGTFIQPVEGRISTEFGEMRYVNGSLTSYRHSGIDIAAPTGTDIVAPNHGVVKLSKSLILTGETIVIDHGYGIFSVYFHLNSRSVDDGATVAKGEHIGTVGSTGFSTGPHLHWTMSHYKTNLSPWLFMDRELIPFENTTEKK